MKTYNNKSNAVNQFALPILIMKYQKLHFVCSRISEFCPDDALNRIGRDWQK